MPIRRPKARWPQTRWSRPRAGPSPPSDAVWGAVQTLVSGFTGPRAQADAVVTDDALTAGRLLLERAIRPVDDRVEIEADRLALVAWLHWARWRVLPDGADRDDLETALRLFLLLSWVDPDGLGAREHLPEEFRAAVSTETVDVAALLVDHARHLLDGLAERVRPVDFQLIATVTDAALLLVPDGDPGGPISGPTWPPRATWRSAGPATTRTCTGR